MVIKKKKKGQRVGKVRYCTTGWLVVVNNPERSVDPPAHLRRDVKNSRRVEPSLADVGSSRLGRRAHAGNPSSGSFKAIS